MSPGVAMPERVGPYAVERELGRGGMGVVYLAHDTRLGRRVALKSLPVGLAADGARLARLEREARALASLSHPNVAGIYGIEEAEGARYLVLELAEGETLGARLARGALPVDEALAVCEQVAAGVEAAHESGVIHRDLKPENVQIGADGRVKVLDFGLAKGAEASRASGFSGASTMPGHGTIPGVVMGTAGYMSPEQARGKVVDKRTDIWSLGCVLYECLAGRRAFPGETGTDAIAAVLEREPDWAALPAKTPRRVRELLRRCLEKDARNRVRDMGDVRLELSAALAGREWSTAAMAAAGTPVRWRGWLRGAVAVLVLGAAVGAGWLLGRSRPGPGAAAPVTAPAQVVRLSLPVVGVMGDAVAGALGPDGTTFAYIGERVGPRMTAGKARQHILVRRLDEADVRSLDGTVGARNVAFSPDSKWVVYESAAGESSHKCVFWKKSLAGGPSVKLCEVPGQGLPHASWSDSGFVLVIGDFMRSVWRVNEDGSGAKVVAKADEATDALFRSVEALPGGRGALATVMSGVGSGVHASVVLINLQDGTVKTLLEDGGQPRYVARGGGGGGLMVFTRGDAMLAAPFDLARLELGPGVSPVLSGVRTEFDMPGAFGVAGESLLWYEPGESTIPQRRLVKMDRKGNRTALTDAGGAALFYGSSNLSPDGKRVACGVISPNKAAELAVVDIPGGTVHRVGQSGADFDSPAWGPDGRLYFSAYEPAQPVRIMSCRGDLSDDPQVLIGAEPGAKMFGPIAFNKDGSMLTCFRFSPEASTDVVAVDMKEKKIVPLVATKARERNGRISPDGTLLVYDADPTGQLEVYIAAMGSGASGGVVGHGVQISTDGGETPLWGPKGDEVFYFSQAGMMSVKLTGGLGASAPTVLVGPEIMEKLDGGDVMPDGDHFVFIEKGESEKARTHVMIVQNWMAGVGVPGR